MIGGAANDGRDGGGVAKALGFGMYLASSWTWCIGMFLPLLLLRDYGVASFAAFAMPNIVGAAAMGWVLRDAAAAERFAKAHRSAARGFSQVTILFHVFFVTWLCKSTPWADAVMSESAGLALLGLGAAAGLMGLGWLVASVPMRLLPGVGFAAWAVSLGLVLALPRPDDAFLRERMVTNPGLLWLAPVMVFGFALCPYLDLTFLRARRSLGAGAGRVAFGVGFGVFFATMIALTMHYSQAVLGGDFGPLPWLLAAHILVQAVFTVGVHVRELSAQREEVISSGAPGGAAGGSHSRAGAGKLLVAALGIGVASAMIPPHDIRQVIWAPGLMPSSENVYRVFMSFYALVFPAYVLLVGLARPDGFVSPPTRRDVLLWLGTVAAAAPMFALGVFARQEMWYLPGLAIVFGVFAWRRRSA